MTDLSEAPIIILTSTDRPTGTKSDVFFLHTRFLHSFFLAVQIPHQTAATQTAANNTHHRLDRQHYLLLTTLYFNKDTLLHFLDIQTIQIIEQ